jgi:hypothetical protein
VLKIISSASCIIKNLIVIELLVFVVTQFPSITVKKMEGNETIFNSSPKMLGMLQKDYSPLINILLWLSHIVLFDSFQHQKFVL